jgi:hypothetical protein
VAPGGPTDLPLQSIALRTGSAPFLTVGSGLPGVGSVGSRQRFCRGRSPDFAAVSRSSCGSFGLSRRVPPLRERVGGLPVGWGVGTTTSRPRDRASPSKTACRFARSFPRLRACGPGGLVRTPLMGFKDRPSADINAVRPLPGRPRPSLRLGSANFRARSVLVVPPDSDGFLRSAPCRSIAPCNRPWGSPCCSRCRSSVARGPRWGGCDLPDGAYPSKLFPPWQLYRVTTACALSLFLAAVPCLPRALPLAFGPVWRVGQPQGFEPPKSPLLTARRCR